MAVHEVSRVEQTVRRCLHGRRDAVVWRKSVAEHSWRLRTHDCEITDPITSDQEENSEDRSEAADFHVRVRRSPFRTIKFPVLPHNLTNRATVDNCFRRRAGWHDQARG